LPTFIAKSSSALASGEDIGGDGGVVFLGALDLLGQAFHLPPDVVLLVNTGGAQLVELADFGIDPDLIFATEEGVAKRVN
jgi:hypothetical protein